MAKLECLDQFMNTTDMKASNFRIYNHKETVDNQFGVEISCSEFVRYGKSNR